MSKDLIEKMKAEYARVCRNYYLADCSTEQVRECEDRAMRAAITVLAANVTDEMVDAADGQFNCNVDFQRNELKEAISASIRSLVTP